MAEDGSFVVIHMAAQGQGRLVEADVWIPDGVRWRPGQPYRSVDA